MKKQRETIWRRDGDGKPLREAEVYATFLFHGLPVHVVLAEKEDGTDYKSMYTCMVDTGRRVLGPKDRFPTQKAAMTAALARLNQYGVEYTKNRYEQSQQTITERAAQQLNLRA